MAVARLKSPSARIKALGRELSGCHEARGFVTIQLGPKIFVFIYLFIKRGTGYRGSYTARYFELQAITAVHIL